MEMVMVELNKQAIVDLLAINDKAVIRALLVLDSNQTEDERQIEHTRHLNGKGFRPCHARMGTNMVKFYHKVGHLTPKQIAYWRRPDRKGNMKIAIYWKQLIEAAEQKRKAA